MSSHRVLGLLAATFGDTEAAATHFEDSLAFAEKAGYVRETVWTQMEYAEVLLDRDEPGDREKAIELQDEALAITQELGDAAAHRTHPGTAGDLAGVEFRMVVLIGHRGIGIPGGLGPPHRRTNTGTCCQNSDANLVVPVIKAYNCSQWHVEARPMVNRYYSDP